MSPLKKKKIHAYPRPPNSQLPANIPYIPIIKDAKGSMKGYLRGSWIFKPWNPDLWEDPKVDPLMGVPIKYP